MQILMCGLVIQGATFIPEIMNFSIQTIYLVENFGIFRGMLLVLF